MGYNGTHTNYNDLFHLSEHEVIPVRHILYRGDQPHLMIMEMQALIKEDDTDADGLFEQGKLPTYDLFKTKDKKIEEVIAFVEALHKDGYDYNDIAIACRVKESVKEFKTSLHKLKIPYSDNSSPVSENRDGVLLSTFHSLKGLEFKAVILADVNNRTAPLYFKKIEDLSAIDKENYLHSERSLLYVAMTRAIAILKITGTGIASELIRI